LQDLLLYPAESPCMRSSICIMHDVLQLQPVALGFAMSQPRCSTDQLRFNCLDNDGQHYKTHISRFACGLHWLSQITKGQTSPANALSPCSSAAPIYAPSAIRNASSSWSILLATAFLIASASVTSGACPMHTQNVIFPDISMSCYEYSVASCFIDWI